MENCHKFHEQCGRSELSLCSPTRLLADSIEMIISLHRLSSVLRHWPNLTQSIQEEVPSLIQNLWNIRHNLLAHREALAASLPFTLQVENASVGIRTLWLYNSLVSEVHT